MHDMEVYIRTLIKVVFLKIVQNVSRCAEVCESIRDYIETEQKSCAIMANLFV